MLPSYEIAFPIIRGKIMPSAKAGWSLVDIKIAKS